MTTPRQAWIPLAICCAFASSSPAAAGGSQPSTLQSTTDVSTNPACVDIRAEARWQGSGYDHWVIIGNQCDRPVACDVATNVNSATLTVAVQPGQTSEVLTFRGSPARTFTPYVTCQLPNEPLPRTQ
jgi:hypothetical protein